MSYNILYSYIVSIISKNTGKRWTLTTRWPTSITFAVSCFRQEEIFAFTSTWPLPNSYRPVPISCTATPWLYRLSFWNGRFRPWKARKQKKGKIKRSDYFCYSLFMYFLPQARALPAYILCNLNWLLKNICSPHFIIPFPWAKVEWSISKLWCYHTYWPNIRIVKLTMRSQLKFQIVQHKDFNQRTSEFPLR